MSMYEQWGPRRNNRYRGSRLSNSIDRTRGYLTPQAGPSPQASAYTTNVNGAQTAQGGGYGPLAPPSVPGPYMTNTQAGIDAARNLALSGGGSGTFNYVSPGGNQAQGVLSGVPSLVPVLAQGQVQGQQPAQLTPEQQSQVEGIDRLTNRILALGGRGPARPKPGEAALAQAQAANDASLEWADGNRANRADQHQTNLANAQNIGTGYERNPGMPDVLADGGVAAREYSQNRLANNDYAQVNPGLSRKFGVGGALQGMPQDTATTRSIPNPGYKPWNGEPQYLTFGRGASPQQSASSQIPQQPQANSGGQVGGDFMARNYTGDGTAGPDGVHVMKNPDGTFAATSRGNLNRINLDRQPLPPSTHRDRHDRNFVRVDDRGNPISPGGYGTDTEGNEQSYENGHRVAATTLDMPPEYRDAAIAQSQRIKDKRAGQGGLTDSQLRRLRTKERTLSNSVRRGILTKEQAANKLKQAVGSYLPREPTPQLGQPATQDPQLGPNGKFAPAVVAVAAQRDKAIQEGFDPASAATKDLLAGMSEALGQDNIFFNGPDLVTTTEPTDFEQLPKNERFTKWWGQQDEKMQGQYAKAIGQRMQNMYQADASYDAFQRPEYKPSLKMLRGLAYDAPEDKWLEWWRAYQFDADTLSKNMQPDSNDIRFNAPTFSM